MDNRPAANYLGDTRSTVGQIVGPNAAGEFLAVDEVTYDPDTNRSRARFRYATATDLAGTRRELG